MKRNVVRGYALSLGGQAWHLVTAFVLYAFLARIFGPARFGEWRIANTLLGWFEIAVLAGVARVATKAIAEKTSGIGLTMRAAYTGQAIVAAATFLLMFLGAGSMAALLGNPGLAPLFRIAALDIPVYALFAVASAYLLGMRSFERQAFGWIAYATAKAVLIAWLASGSWSVSGALIGNAISSLIGFAAMFAPLPAAEEGGGSVRVRTRELVLASGPFLTLALIDGVTLSSDLWIVSAVFSSGPLLGLYAAAAVLAEVPVFLFVGLNRVIFPSVAAACAEGDAEGVSRNILLGVRTALIVSVMGVAVAAFGGRGVLAFLFSAEYGAAAVPLAFIMVASMGRTVLATASEVLMALDRRRIALAVSGGTALAQIALVLALAPRFGLAGAASGAAIAALAGAGFAAYALRVQLGVRPFATLVRSAAAASVACVPLALLPAASPLLVPTLLGSSAAYLVLLRLVRELSPADLSSIRSGLAVHHSREDLKGEPPS